MTILTISDILPILTMVCLKICLLFSLAAVLPSTQALKCIQCTSVNMATDTKACDDATTVATDCPSGSNEACLSVYTTTTKTMVRSCSTTLLVDALVTAANLLGKGEK